MTVTTETATVYRGGGRRWFSKKAAIKAEASKLYRQRFKPRCECDKDTVGIDYTTGYFPETCYYHQDAFRTRFLRRVARLISKEAT